MNAPVHFDRASATPRRLPLDQIDVSDPRLYQDDVYFPYFERLRREDPVHYRNDGMYGSFWSVTKFKDIMTVETHPRDLLVGGEARRHHASPTGRWNSGAPASSRWIRRGTTSSARWSARSSRRRTSTTCRASSASARARARRAAARRNVRLGAARVDRADHADAGDAVRLPVRGAPTS